MTLIEALCLTFFVLGGMCYVIMSTLVAVLENKSKPTVLMCIISYILWPLLLIKDVIGTILKGSNNKEA